MNEVFIPYTLISSNALSCSTHFCRFFNMIDKVSDELDGSKAGMPHEVQRRPF